jgi:L-cysteate sulfo-lyase
MKLSYLPRAKLAVLPTPLQEMPNLSKELGGPRILVKRDDLTGLAFGGNKARKLEYLMGDALEHKADYIVTGAGFHSNWCTQTAAAARRLGMKVILVKSGPVDGYDPEEYDGNHLLHFLLGSDIKIMKEGARNARDEILERLKEKGHRPYSMPVGGSTPTGAAGYMHAMLELVAQSVEQGIKIDYLIHASGSGGTQAGLVSGAKALNSGIKVLGVSTGSGAGRRRVERITNLVHETAELLDLDFKCTEDDVNLFDEYAEGYGYMIEGKAEAIKMVAETEGLFIDPVYTASAMMGLIDLCRQDYFKPDDTVVFLHTGGTAALFPYRVPLKAYVQGKKIPWKIPEWSPDAA